MKTKQTLRVLLMAGSMEHGGSERQTCLLLKHLDRAKYSPRLYLTRRTGDLLAQVPPDVVIHSFDDAGFRPRLNWPGRYHRAMVEHLSSVIESDSIDLVYDRTFHMTLLAGPACAPGRNDRSVPRIATIVSPPDQDLPHSEPRFLKAKRRLLATAYQQASRVIAVSEAVRQSAIDYYHLNPNHVQTIRNPVDIDSLRHDADQAGHAVPLDLQDTSRFHIACIGRMTYEKGHDLLLRAILQLKKSPTSNLTMRPPMLWMIGDGPLRNELQDFVERNELWDHVRFLGGLAPEVTAAILARSQLLVCPSRHEGLPNVILEAMALRIPVLATNVGGIPELVVDQHTGRLVEADSVDSLARGIAVYADMVDQTRLAWTAAAYELVEDQFSLERYLERLRAVFEKYPD